MGDSSVAWRARRAVRREGHRPVRREARRLLVGYWVGDMVWERSRRRRQIGQYEEWSRTR